LIIDIPSAFSLSVFRWKVSVIPSLGLHSHWPLLESTPTNATTINILLAAGADVNTTDSSVDIDFIRTPLSLAMEKKDIVLIERLLQSMANVETEPDDPLLQGSTSYNL
jgi:hypothetical protein